MLNSKLNFSTVEGFNSCVGYVKITGVVSRYVTLGCNFADIVDNFSDKLDSSQVSFLLSSILVDKFKYMYLSFNMTRKIANLSQVYSKLCKWNQFNTVVVYYHPQLGVIVLNPQDNRGWQNIEFVSSEFVSIYTKPKQDLKKEQAYDYLVDVKKVIEGDTTSDKSHYTGLTSVVKNIKQVKMDLAKKQSAKVDKSSGSPDEPIVVQRATSPQQARIAQAIEHSVDKPPEQTLEKPVPPSTVQEKPKTRRLTPKYSVQVSNELFHNGNVEAVYQQNVLLLELFLPVAEK